MLVKIALRLLTLLMSALMMEKYCCSNSLQNYSRDCFASSLKNTISDFGWVY